jgi:hypothetical protein
MIRKEPPLTRNQSEKHSAPTIIEPQKKKPKIRPDRQNTMETLAYPPSKALGANGGGRA